MSDDEFTPKPDIKKGRYRHYSGKEYEVLDVVCHSESLEWMVLYKRLYEADGPELCVRPYEMFMEDIEYEGKTRPRFQYIDNTN